MTQHWKLNENQEVTTIDPALFFLQDVLPEKESMFSGSRPFRNHFKTPNGLFISDRAIAFHVTQKPDRSLSVSQMQELYRLPDFSQTIFDYIYAASNSNPTPEWDICGDVTVWKKFPIQLHSSFRSRFINRSQVVQTIPPSNHSPGCCDAVLVQATRMMCLVMSNILFMPLLSLIASQMLLKYAHRSNI